MTVHPVVGQKGGQEYNVPNAIRNFLGQMMEGETRVAPAVIKELIQNADDAGADSIWVVLDERVSPENISGELSRLYGPALIVGNNASFRTADEVKEGEKDDFAAICDVASGHKRAQATAAGRFGIGFNSVYFLTDLPVIFSRREVHVFDLLHHVFKDANGWKFSLDEFRADAASSAGPIKNAFEWIFPKSVLNFSQSFGAIAIDLTADYSQTVFRLPLRVSEEGSPTLCEDRFNDRATRLQLLHEITEQAARSLLFLKNVSAISIGILREQQVERVGHVTISDVTSDYRKFVADVDESARRCEPGDRLECTLRRNIDWWTELNEEGSDCDRKSLAWSFEVKHVARFDEPDLLNKRERLERNDEKAIPWASIAIPLDLASLHIDGGMLPAWRVFLPLEEPGPCGCPLNAALFVGPSRRNNEFRIDGSDEAKRKTDWNKAMVERALLPLLREATADIPELCSSFSAESPREYLSLFPVCSNKQGPATSLSEHLKTCFFLEPWILRVHDLWGMPIDLFVASDGDPMILEMIPNWLAKYQSRFQTLSGDHRRFISVTLGNALKNRIDNTSSVTVRRQCDADVYKSILTHPEAPDGTDLRKLLAQFSEAEAPSVAGLDGLWSMTCLSDEAVMRYHADHLYMHADSLPSSGIHHALLSLDLSFDNTHWVSRRDGLPSLPPERRRELDNVVPADDNAVFELLCRLDVECLHDSFEHARQIEPVIDFLICQGNAQMTPDLRLGFLIRTAQNKHDRRDLGVILIRSETPSSDDTAMWDAVFRRTFAEVHPDFAPALRRLLMAIPKARHLLDDPDCRVVMAERDEAFDILHSARKKDPTVIERIAADFERARRRGGSEAAAVERTTVVLLNHASQRWAEFSPIEQTTVLALPIHRKPDGTMTSLAEASADAPTPLHTYRLQSKDDFYDAPIELSECELLQPLDPSLASFYRQQLGIEVHGRIAVLKDVLRQIGTNHPNKETLLAYLAKYFTDTVQHLLRSTDTADHEDAEELQQLMISAETVPCLDGFWRVAEGCTDCSGVARLLKNQGWKKERLTELLAALFHGQAVATVDQKLQKLIRSLHELEEWPTEQVYEIAVTSESAQLDIGIRCKLMLDNWPESPADVTRATFLDTARIPTCFGINQLQDCVCVIDADLGPNVLKYLLPASVDPTEFGEQFAVAPADVPKLLTALSVPSIQVSEVQERIVSDFRVIWSKLDDSGKIELLNYVGSRNLATQLSSIVADLDVVRVEDSQISWVTAEAVIAPSWLKLRPPVLSPRAIPLCDGLTSAGRDVWDEWCGLKQFYDVLPKVIECADKLRGNDRRDAAVKINQWVDLLIADEFVLNSDLSLSLREHPWVLARRGNETQFQQASDVVVQKGESILARRFWVPVVSLPRLGDERIASIGLLGEPPANEESITSIASCLEQAISANRSDLTSVYRLLHRLISEEQSLKSVWLSASTTRQVFRLYRDPDTPVCGLQLFTGRTKDKDIGKLIYSLRSSTDPPSSIARLYEDLGVSTQPTAAHAVFALQQLHGPCSNQLRNYDRLIDILLADETERPSHAELREIRILTCGRTFEPIEKCYWDEEWGVEGHVRADGESRLIDSTRESNQRLIQFLDAQDPDIVLRLRYVADVDEAAEAQPVEIRSNAAQTLGPWQDWFDDLQRPDSTLRAEVEENFTGVPMKALKISGVASLRNRYRLPDGSLLHPSEEWMGPAVEHNDVDKVFVSREAAEIDYRTDPDSLKQLDHLVTKRVAELLVPNDAPSSALVDSLLDIVNRSLERPSAYLARIRQVNEDHFFHQFYDQVADPDFAPLFDKFRKTRESSNAYNELKDKMWSILRDRFVKARRAQIRGHGYDELSVFAELVQNAEDAYAQRQSLGLDSVDKPYASFSYDGSGDRVLVMEHRGRPFNFWRHGDREDRNYSRDVDGVLRSAGSYKPLSQNGATTVPTVGRFGLGFKSVYLLTDSPIIHSGQWHFQINDGCLPKELPPPHDLNLWDTRIILPLREDVQDLEDPHGRVLATLLPFLRCIRRLSLSHLGPAANEGLVDVELEVEKTLSANQEGVFAEVNAVHGVTHVSDNVLRFVRLRSNRHAGQLGIYLGPNGSPSLWCDAFGSDMYAVLPLRTYLGTGIGVSHLLEVQSGRTHLVDPETNRQRFAEVAGLLACIPQLVAELEPEERASKWFLDFWCLWIWDRGDAETKDLREALAQALVSLAHDQRVVPTLAPMHTRRLGDKALYYFSRVPDIVRDLVVEYRIALDASGTNCLRPEIVVPEAFANAFRRICSVAGEHEPEYFPDALTWTRLGEIFSTTDALASNPKLLSDLADVIPETQEVNVTAWLGNCKVSALDGELATGFCDVARVLSHQSDGLKHLPRRLLLVLDDRYGPSAVALLAKVGLQRSLPAQKIELWIEEARLTAEEGRDLLQYLHENDRYKDQQYRRLKEILRTSWFPHEAQLLTLRSAIDLGLLGAEFLEDPEFEAWLGLIVGAPEEPPPPEIPPVDAALALSRLYEWWATNGTSWTRQYEIRTYPGGMPPELSGDFLDTTDERRRWLVMLLVGSFQGMQATPDQHRGFLKLCERRGWMNVFADRQSSAQRWLEILEQYFDEKYAKLSYYQWMRHFVRIFQLSRWLGVYVNQFLFINQREHFGMSQILRPEEDPVLSGGGETAPDLPLGLGACFVLRELTRLGVINQTSAHRYCYMPVKRVRDTMADFGCLLDNDSNPEQSTLIYRFIAEHLGDDKASFGNSFDLPLQALYEDSELRRHVFEEALPAGLSSEIQK